MTLLNESKALLETARRLVAVSQKDASETDANRAVSTAYYAVFAHLAGIVADKIAGRVDVDGLNGKAWVRAYRSVDHKPMRDAFLRAVGLTELDTFKGLKAAASAFQRLQTARESADYDPMDNFSPDQARALILEAQFVVDELSNASPEALGVIVVEIILRTKQRQAI